MNYFRWISASRLQALYTPAFRARLGNAEAMAPMLEFLQPLSTQAEPLERMPALEQRFFLADHNLIYTDKMSMAVGVQLRAACGVQRSGGETSTTSGTSLLRAACSVDVSYTLLSLLCIDIWCRRFLDGSPRRRGAVFPSPIEGPWVSERGGISTP